MTTISATEAQNNLNQLWSEAANGPVTVLSAGQPVAVVLSPAEFNRLTARRSGIKAGFAKHLFPGVDMHALLDTSIDDVFEDYR
jgi:prevent-host-death family protein